MITMRAISRTFAEILNTDTGLKALSNSLISDEFNYYVNVDLATIEVKMPYFGIVTFNNMDDKEVKKAFKVQFLIGIAREAVTTVNRISEEPTLDKLEQLTIKAVEVIAKELRDFGISNEKNIKIAYINMYVPTPDGEDDLQMQVDIELEQEKFLCN